MKIHSNISPPPIHSSAKLGQSKYPFDTMEINDSFEVDLDKRHSVNTLARKYGEQQKPKKKFTVRIKDKVLYCWRVK